MKTIWCGLESRLAIDWTARVRKALLIYQEDYPWDVRVEKFCRALMDAGYEVHLIASDRAGRGPFEVVDGVSVHRLRHFRRQVYGIPAFFNPFWYARISSVADAIRPDVVIVRDLPLAPTAIAASIVRRTPVVFDMAENYPAAVMEWKKTGEYGAFHRLIRNVALLKMIERASIKRADMVMVVAEENRARLLEMGVPSDKTALVLNTPELRAQDARLANVNGEGGASKTILYVGGFEIQRGLVETIDAMSHIAAVFPEARLEILGDGPMRSVYEQRVRDKEVSAYVTFAGYVRFQDIFARIAQSDLCIVPHRRSAHTDTTLPNKLFDYMGMGKPVLVSDCVPLKRIVEEERCGMVFRSGDSADLAVKAVALLSSPEIERMGHDGRKAVERRYNWEIDKKELLRAVKAVLPDGGRDCGETQSREG